MNRMILLTAVAILMLAHVPVALPQDSSPLDESSEQDANALQPPEQIMNLIGVRPGLVIGEVGAGRGRMTVHLATRVGEKGRIYASDPDQADIDSLKERCRRQGLSNVETVLGVGDDARFPKNSLDLAFMAGVFHRLDRPVPLLKSLLPSLKPWASVVMIEPAPGGTGDLGRALTRDRLSEEAAAAGFQVVAFVEGRLKEDNLIVLSPIVPDTPASEDPRKVRALWEAYLAWRKAAGGTSSLRDYAVSLDREGVPAAEIRRRLHVLRGQFTEQPEGIEMIYDPLYGKPLTGDLEKDGFKTAPNAFLVEVMKEIKPGGKALDVGAGMGRNAIHLAQLGWDVTGIDLSGEGLAVMRSSAEKAGLKVETVKTSYDDFDFGDKRWDLVAMILSWAPVEDPAFLSRLKKSVRPGGYVVFEHVLQREEDPFPPGVHAPAPGALRELFRDFEVLTYREVEDYGDWGGPPTGHVRMVARKRGG